MTNRDVGTMTGLLNRALAGDTEGEQFVTLAFARIEPETRALVYASAGHPPGYVLDGAGAVKAKLPSTGPPLGVFPEAEVAVAPPLALAPGDVVLLLTDGVAEAGHAGGAAFSTPRALDLVRSHRDQPARGIVERLYAAVREYCPDGAHADDVTALVVKV